MNKLEMIEVLAPALYEEWRKGAEGLVVEAEWDDLGEELKEENRAAAEVVVDILLENGGEVDLENAETRNRVGKRIHDAWLERNWFDEDDYQIGEFVELSVEEQEKDIEQLRVAMELLEL